MTPFFGVLRLLLLPLVVLMRPLVSASSMERQSEVGEVDEASEGEIAAYISVGQREGILDPGEEALVMGVVEFGDKRVKSVMTPRIDTVAASVETPPDELASLFLESGHSRIPLYRESMDEVVGVLHLRDLITQMRSEQAATPESLLIDPFVVPETKPISELLEEFQARHQQLAVVVDEFGGMAGVVTVEDLLEEIVGEIADEYEKQSAGAQLRRVDDRTSEVDAVMHVDEINERLGIELPEDDSYETLAGFLFSQWGRIPQVGERIVHGGVDFEVVDADERRIKFVRIRVGEQT